MEVEGQYKWSSGETSTFRAYAPGQPDDHMSNEDCFEIGLVFSTDVWNDFTCGTTISFLCEVEGKFFFYPTFKESF